VSTPLLSTKLYIPPIRSDLVARPRLVQRLDAKSNRKLTLVSAPAGFGKTTLLSEWIHEQKQDAAWISLDKGDNDPARFLAYFISAFHTIEHEMVEETFALLESPQPPPVEVILTPLINSISERSSKFSIVLDDYHVITNAQVHEAVRFTMANMPPQIHLIISSRSDPPWPLSRMRARGEMAEIRANDLRFTAEEVTKFLNHVMEFDLSPEDVKLLESRTEGWIAGLQMAALSMQGRKDLSGFIKALTGSHRFIMDYLVEEVIDKQSREIQEFLLKTSILARMNGPLCDFVTESTDSQQTIAYLEQANLFLVHLDDERCWYRYHHLFSGLLRTYQEEYRPGRAPELHRRASIWFEEQGLIADAVEHALAADDLDRVVDLLEGNAFAMMDHGQLASLKGWLDTLPVELVNSRPWLCLSYTWIAIYTGQLQLIEPFLADVEAGLDGIESKEEIEHINGHMIAIRAYRAELLGEFEIAIENASRALIMLPQDDLRTRCFATMRLSVSQRLIGELDEASRAFKEALTLSREIGDSHIAVNVLCDLAGLYIIQGRLREIDNLCQEALKLAETHFRRSGWWMPITGYAYARISQVAYEQNDLETALRSSEKAIELCRAGGLKEYLTDSYVFRAIALQAAGDIDGAFNAIHEAKSIALNLSDWYKEIVEPYEAAIYLAQGDAARASQLVDERDFIRKDEHGLEFFTNNIMQARVLVKLCEQSPEQLDDVMQFMEKLRLVAEDKGANSFVLKILALESVAEWLRGNSGQALLLLQRSIVLAEPEGYIRPFIDLGPAMGNVLKHAVTQGVSKSFVGKLLNAMQNEPWAKDLHLMAESSTLSEPISERELQVLRLLHSDLSTPEIAQELVVAVSTVRSHIKNIYSKLNVHSRMEAVDRAKELNLL